VAGRFGRFDPSSSCLDIICGASATAAVVTKGVPSPSPLLLVLGSDFVAGFFSSVRFRLCDRETIN